jgi:apoptosis-inducing factor 3
MEKVLGSDMGDFLRRLHEEHGVRFHLTDAADSIDRERVFLKSGLVLKRRSRRGRSRG